MIDKLLIAPSILSADYLNLQRDVQVAAEGGADYFHIDLMDGVFVPHLTFGPDIIQALRAVTSVPLDAHLMVDHPENYIQNVIQAGANLINIHVESTPHIYRVIQQVQELGAQAGVVINPGTSLAAIETVLPIVDNVLVMTVNPGFGGQKFIPSTLLKIQQLARLKQKNYYHYSIEVDGGINEQTIEQCQEAGANIFVAGSYIFGHNISQRIANLKQVIVHEKS